MRARYVTYSPARFVGLVIMRAEDVTRASKARDVKRERERERERESHVMCGLRVGNEHYLRFIYACACQGWCAAT